MGGRKLVGSCLFAFVAAVLLVYCLAGSASAATYWGGDQDGRSADITLNSSSISVVGNTTEAGDAQVEVLIERSYNGTNYY